MVGVGVTFAISFPAIGRTMALTRRLAAILAADVVGYSRLMGIDEVGTHQSFTAHRTELFVPKIEEHRGRIVKSTGDGLLAEFPSVVEAVLCAVEVQCGMRRRNHAAASDMQIQFRIGINMGDIIAEPEDIFGDGVNIAARLEALAEPNGICISQLVHEQVRGKVPYTFADIGHQSVKNIAQPLHVFALGSDAIAALATSEGLGRDPPPARPPPPASYDLRAPRWSIVVLPFKNLSDDGGQQYLADAITEDVTADLSRIADLQVIAPDTAFTYAERSVEPREIGRELNIRFVLNGSVRRLGNRIRVNTRLINAETNVLVSAERYHYEADDLFALQDEVTRRIAVALDLELTEAEAGHPSPNPGVLDYLLRGRAALYSRNGSTREGFTAGICLVERALDLDTSSAAPRVVLALLLTARVFEQMSDSPTGDLDRAKELIEEALVLSPGDPRTHFAKAQILRAEGQYEAAIPEYEAAISHNRNWVVALAALGICKFFAGSLEEAIPAQEEAIRLSPRDPRLPNWYWRIGMVHLLQSRTTEAVLWLEKARTINPNLSGPRAWLASAYALQDKIPAARGELALAVQLSGDGRYNSITSYKKTLQLGVPRVQALAENTFFLGLELAGMAKR